MEVYKRSPIDTFRKSRKIKRLISKAEDGIALQAAGESNKAKEFLKNQYQSPTTKAIFDSNAQTVKSQFDINSGYQDILNEINNSRYDLDLDSDPDETITGRSYGRGNPIEVAPYAKGFDWTAFIHEYTHNLKPLGCQHPSLEYINQQKLNSVTPEYKRSRYFDNSDEIYSRLMEFCQDANMLPDKRDYQYNEEFINTYQDLLKKHKLDRYGENVTRLLNEVAYIPSNTENNIV